MAQTNTQVRNIQPTIQRYGLALLSVVIALGSALFMAAHNFEWVGLRYYLLYILFASLIAWLRATRRHVESEFLRTRDDLQAIKEPGVFWRIIHAAPPGTVRK